MHKHTCYVVLHHTIALNKAYYQPRHIISIAKRVASTKHN